VPSGRLGRCGEYELLDRIGEGGMAEVFKARLLRSSGFEKTLVIKRILPRFAKNPHFVKMFVNEAKITARIQHQNVVQVFELGQTGEGDLFIAMEHIDGLDLRAVIELASRRGVTLPAWFGAHVVSEVLGGLSHAHSLNDDRGRPLRIVHRDVTPANVFISFTGEVKLADFGVAKVLDSPASWPPTANTNTNGGELKGNISYMPPEQIRAEALDVRADLFSAGVVLWEALTAQRLFGGRADFEVMLSICEGDRVPPSRLNTTVPPSLDAIVLRALEIDRERRFSSAVEMQDKLREVIPKLNPRLDATSVRRFIASLVDRPNDPLEPTEETLRIAIANQTTASERADSPFHEESSVWMPDPPDGIADDLHLEPPARTTVPDLPRWEPEPIEAWPGSGPYAGPNPFYLRVPDRTRGPMEYRVLLKACEVSDPRITEISADAKSWVSIEELARLSGLDYLAPDNRPVFEASLIGSLDARSLTSVFASLALRQATGRLILTSGTLKRSIDLFRGAPTFVRTDRPDLQLPILAARRDFLPRESVADVVHQCLREQRTFEELIQRGVPLPGFDRRRLLMCDRLTEVFRWRQGRFAFHPKAEGLRTTPFAPSLVMPLLELVQRCYADRELRGILASRFERRLETTASFGPIVALLELRPPFDEIARRLADGATIAHLAQRAPTAVALAYVLLESEALRTR
jgi:eukaryotic-like serine/threonine-protein kinase